MFGNIESIYSKLTLYLGAFITCTKVMFILTIICSMADAFFFDLCWCLNQTPQNNDEGGA